MKLKWIEDKSQDNRGNFASMCFKLDNSDYIFAYASAMSYKTFKALTRQIAQRYNSNTVEVMQDQGLSNMLIREYDDKVKFFIELDVEEGQKRQFKYFEENTIFKN